MLNQQEIDCLRAVNQCASACLQCMIGCLEGVDTDEMVRCIALDTECADICRLAAASIARGDEHQKTVLLLCAEACQSCGNECGKHPMSHCQYCAKACANCAAACRALAH